LSVWYSGGGVKGSCERRLTKIVFVSEGWVGFLLELFVYRATFIIGWMVAATEGTFDIFRSFLSVTEMCEVMQTKKSTDD
jgi:hypothetical protein